MTDQAQSESAPGAAALVIRVWRETGPGGLKARITERPDLGAEAETTTVVTSPEAVYREVRHWLEEFVGRTGGQS
jgi:hypothetical protein